MHANYHTALYNVLFPPDELCSTSRIRVKGMIVQRRAPRDDLETYMYIVPFTFDMKNRGIGPFHFQECDVLVESLILLQCMCIVGSDPPPSGQNCLMGAGDWGLKMQAPSPIWQMYGRPSPSS